MKINSSVAANSYLLDAVTNNIDQGSSVRSFSLHSVRSIIMRLMMVMMIVGGWNVVWGQNMTLTFNLNTNPGGWPTANSTTLTNYTYPLNGVNYTFALKNVKQNSGYLMLTSTAVLGLPAISGYKLTKVVAYNSGGCSTSVVVGISSSSTDANYISGGDLQTWSTTSSSYTYNLSGTAANTMYYLYVPPTKNAQIIKLILTYAPAVSYTISAQSNNTSLGTVSVSGSVITASPNGCVGYASPAYTVTSGAANVLQSGNTFNVTPTSNCTVRINFEAIPTYTVSFSTGSTGIVAPSPITETACGAGVRLPSAIAPAGCDPEYTFFGWSTLPVTETTTVPNTIVGTAGQTYHPSGNITLHAVYKQGDERESIVAYDFSDIDGFEDWGTAYSNHEVEYNEATVIFASANHQSSGNPITDIPVTKGQPVSVAMNNNTQRIKEASFVCKQWGTKTQTITMYYSTNDGSTYTSTGTTSTNFTISNNSLPSGTNAVKISFSNSSNQVGIESCTIKISSTVNIYNSNPSCTPITCPAPTSLIAMSTGENTANLSWTAMGEETEWEYYYSEVNAAPTTSGIQVFSNSVDITGIDVNTTYYWWVRAVCDRASEDYSLWVAGDNFPITILEPGDLAIVAINNKLFNGNTADEFSFMVFKNITAETSIDMTDNGYERNYAGYWGTEEGFWRITRKNRSLAAGSVVTISETVGRIGYNVEPALGTNINIYANGSLDNANWTIEVNGPLDLNREDQIWMMQGGSWNVLADNKADYTGNVLYGFTATGWETNVGFDDTHGSRIYPSSGCFVTTIEVGEGIVKYTGPLDHATKGEWITRINNEDNWTDYTTSNYPNAARNYCNASRPDATNYPSVNYPLTIDPGDFTKGKWNGKESDDWCDCRNWVSLVVPDENFDVEIPDVGNRNRVSLHEGVTAKCKTLTVKSGGFFNNTQANSVLEVEDDITIDAGGSFRPSENNAFEIIVGGNILNNGVFITNENTSLTLNGESSQNISAPSSGGNFKLRNLTIASPSNVFDADTIELYGNLRDNSASNLGFNLPQALTFKGPSSQTSTRTAITDITMNKSSNNLTLSGMLTVDGKAKFVKGNIIGNVTFSASATSAGASIDSYVDGTVTKKANASAFSFPTGSNGVLGTLEVSSLDADTDLKFNHEPDGFDASEMPVWWNQNNMCGPNEGNAKFDHVTNMYFWNLGTSATIADAVFSVSADDDVHFNSETIEHDNADIDMAIYDGCWKNLGGTASTSDPYHLISVSDVDLPATRAGGDKVVTFGSIDHNTLLPIELAAFSAECNGSYAKISWSTATERNNDYFVLERSDDAISFDEIARLAGAGTSINPIDYTYIDNNVHGGDIFYRLVQVDYDGTRSVSEIIAVNCAIDADGEPEMAVYPNPFANDLTLHFENFGDRVALVEVYDMLGRMLVSRKVVCSQNDYEFVLPLGGLPDGAYNVRVSAEDVVINRQVVKNR